MTRLRNRRFRSPPELNAVIRELLEGINGKVTRHLGASRRDLFETLDRPALKPLPASPCEYAEWLERKVGLDYHVEIERHYYSVPHQLLKKKVWGRITARTVVVRRGFRGATGATVPFELHEGQRVAARVRSSANRRHTTVAEHMPVRRTIDAPLVQAQWRAPACGLDPGADPAACRTGRPQYRHPRRPDPAHQNASRAGLPRSPLSLGPMAFQCPGSGLPPDAGDRRHLVQLGQLDPEE
nr:hypothetical protein [Mangrovicoccus sp. HB161399]